MIHKKCTRPEQSEYLFNKMSKDTLWEWIDCQSKKFPFVTLTNHEIQKVSFNTNHEIQNISFNSNFNCKRQTTVSDPNLHLDR